MVVGHVVAVLAAWSLAQVVVWRHGGDAPGGGWGLGSMALFGGVLGAYALDRLVDAQPPRRRSFVQLCVLVMFVGGVLVAAGVACVPRIAPVVAGLSVVAVAYVPLKRWAPKGLLVAGAWSVACVWLPCERALGTAEGTPTAACIALVVLANVVLCDTQDIETDRLRGVVGVAPWLGARRAAAIAACLAVAGGAASVWLGVWPLACAALPLALMGWWCNRTKRRTRRAWVVLTADVLMVLPGVAAIATRIAG
ncbi:MAG: hypothetical protein QM783_20010 [Phycisphaerales bacterium]